MGIRIPIPRSNVMPQETPGGLVSPNVPSGLGALGEGMRQMSQVMAEQQHQADVLRVEDAVNQQRQQQLALMNKVQGLRGQQVFDPKAYGGQEGQSLDQAAAGWFDGTANDLASGLANDRQRLMFKQATDRMRLQFGGLVQEHLNSQTAVVAKDTYTSAMVLEDQNVAQNGVTTDGRIQGAVIDQSLARKLHAAQQLSSFLGETPDMAKARALEASSGTHALVMDSLLKSNQPQAAQAYFDMHKGELEPKVIGLMESKIRENVLAGQVQTQADRIEGLGLSLDQQDAEARKAMANNPEGMKALQSELEHRFSIKKTAQDFATRDVTGKLWDMRFPTLPGQQAQSLTSIMRTPEWASLNGTQRNDLRAEWERFAKRNENDPATLVAKYATFLRLTDDPKALVGLSDGQIASYMGALGPDLTMKLMATKREAMGDLDKLNKAVLTDVPMKDIAGEYGLKVKGNLAPEDLAKLGQLRDKAMDAIREEQLVTGKALLPERKEEIVRGLLQKVTTKASDHWWKKDPFLFEVGSFMDLAATDVEKTQALDYLTQAGAAITPSNVATMVTAIREKKATK